MTVPLFSQDTIFVKNKSFDGKPERGISFSNLDGWNSYEYGEKVSPIDVHGIGTKFWGSQTEPFEGPTFIGLVVREDGSGEGVAQRLDIPLFVDSTYIFSLHMCISEKYSSPIKSDKFNEYSFVNPVIVEIWGYNIKMKKSELLAATSEEGVGHFDWKKYDFELKPSEKWEVLLIKTQHCKHEGFYNGHVLIDLVSDIIKQ